VAVSFRSDTDGGRAGSVAGRRRAASMGLTGSRREGSRHGMAVAVGVERTTYVQSVTYLYARTRESSRARVALLHRSFVPQVIRSRCPAPQVIRLGFLSVWVEELALH